MPWRAEYPDRPFVPWADALAQSATLVFGLLPAGIAVRKSAHEC
jgi:hypothetical protein